MARLAGPKSGRGYPPHEFVQGLIWMLHAGGRRLEDLRELRAEQEVLGALGLEAVPDAGTVGDWLRRQGEKGAAALRSDQSEADRALFGSGGRSDAGCGRDGDRGGEAGRAMDLSPRARVHAAGGICGRGVRGARVSGRQRESGGGDPGVCAAL